MKAGLEQKYLWFNKEQEDLKWEGRDFMYNPEQPVFEEQPESNIEIAYGIEDVPKPCWKAVLFALQITLVDFTPFMWAAGFASLAGIDQPDFVPTLLCACFFCMGICTFLQTTVGNRLPIVQGSSSARKRFRRFF